MYSFFSDACDLAKNVVNSSDALCELLVSVNHDIDIYMTGKEFDAKDQGREDTCYALACATVLHMAMKQIHGRDGGHPGFEELKDKVISQFGKPTRIEAVLEKNCPEYRLRYREASIQEAKEAISEKRPVIACFKLPKEKMLTLRKYPWKWDGSSTGILTKRNLDFPTRPSRSKDPGHAVVLTSYNSKSLTFMNSWGANWANGGFFSVENTEVLGGMTFYDVYWEKGDLSEKEQESYKKSEREAAAKLIKSLKGLESAKYICPECQQESLVTEFTGTLSKAQCPKCFCEFSTNDNDGNRLALNIYLISLSS